MNENFKNEDFRQTFSPAEEKEFTDFLNEVEMQDRWVEAPLSSFYLKEIDMTDAPTLVEGRTSTGLALITDGEAFPVFPEAMYSIRRRAKNNAEIFSHLTVNEGANMLNMSWAHISGNSKILVRGGKVLATHSDRYVPIQQSSIFKSFKDQLIANYGNAVFECAAYSHDATSCVYEIDSDNLLAKLRKALIKEGIMTGGDIKVYVECTTGDTGLSSVTAYPSIDAKGRRNYFTAPVSIEHRDTTSFSDVINGFGEILAVVSKGVENLERLLKIHLTYPAVIARKLALNRKYQIPKGLVKDIEPQLMMSEYKGEPITAYDFFFTLCEMFRLPEFDALTPKRKIRVKDAVARVALFSEEQFRKMDVNDAIW